eukprot:Lankesteria_metandrocarpae@DN5212_c1_g1_i4.p2
MANVYVQSPPVHAFSTRLPPANLSSACVSSLDQRMFVLLGLFLTPVFSRTKYDICSHFAGAFISCLQVFSSFVTSTTSVWEVVKGVSSMCRVYGDPGIMSSLT